jgi:hypothetical protein
MEGGEMVRFAVDPGRTALVIVDMRNCFVAGSPIAAPQGTVVAGRLNRLAAAWPASSSSGPGMWYGPTAATPGSSASSCRRSPTGSSATAHRRFHLSERTPWRNSDGVPLG